MAGRGATIASLALLAFAAPADRADARSRSVGTPQEGALRDGFRIPLTGATHRFAGPVQGRGTQWATLEVAALVARAARYVDRVHPGPPLVLGDASVEGGGPVKRHVSHRSGRDVDLLFYVRSRRGRPVPAPGFHAFDGRGRCTDRGCDLRLDVQRTWALVRTLVASREPAVQYLFVSEPIRARLLRHARGRGEHPEILRRARRVLHQPSDGASHDDHFHLRTYCASGDRDAGCEDTGPRWPWIDDAGRAERIR